MNSLDLLRGKFSNNIFIYFDINATFKKIYAKLFSLLSSKKTLKNAL